MSKDLSVCIMTVNRPRSLVNTLRSLKLVTLPFRLIIVHEDHPIPEKWIRRNFKDVNLVRFTGGTIGEKKNKYLRKIRTPFFLKLDDDMIVHPGAVEHLYWLMQNIPRLGAITGMSARDGVFPVYGGHSNYYRLGAYLFRKMIPLNQVAKNPTSIYDHIPEGHTLFRTCAFPLGYDTNYEVGYSHYDTQFMFNLMGWYSGTTRYALFDHRHGSSSKEYLDFHNEKRLELLKKSREHFKKKWGLEIIDPRSDDKVAKLFYMLQKTIETIKHPEIYQTRGSPLERIRGLLNV